MVRERIVGVDLGTTAIKAGLFDLAGDVIAQAESGYAIQRRHPGWAEQDAEEWWRSLRAVLHELFSDGRDARVAAIGICSQVNTHLLVDARDRSLAGAILWQDRRCAAVARELNDAIAADPERLPPGYWVDASALVARAEWARRNARELWKNTRLVLAPKDYLNLRLTGRAATDALSSIGLVDDEGHYQTAVLDLVPGLSDALPAIRDFRSALGTVRDMHEPSIGGATVAVGTMDAWANLYGSGATSAGDGIDIAGTSEILGVLSDTAYTTPGIVTFPPVDGLRLHAGPTQASGAALQWFAELVGLPLQEVLLRAKAAPPGSGGLVFLPHLAGERAPLWNSDARGVFFGLSTDHRLEHLCRAVLEGVAFSARHLLEEVDKACGFRTASLRLSGGGSRSDLWCQIRADVIGRQLERTHVRHSGMLGAALIAAVAAGLVPDMQSAAADAVRVERVFEPDASRSAHYDELYAIYRQLYPALVLAYSHLAQIDRNSVVSTSGRAGA